MTVNNIKEIIEVNARVAETALPEPTYRPGILSDAGFAERYRTYSSLDGMAVDFLTTDAAYIEARNMVSQFTKSGRQVSDWLVGRRLTPVAQITTVTVTYGAGGQMTAILTRRGAAPVTVGPVAMAVDSTTSATALAAAINASAAAPWLTALGVGGTVTITSDTAGVAFVTAVSTTVAGTLAAAITTANHGIAEDGAEIKAAGGSWYATLETSRSERNIAELAPWIETERKIFVGQSNEAGLIAAAYSVGTPYTDIGSELKTLAYNRTAVCYHAIDAEVLAGGAVGYVLPFIPGTINWALKQIVGCTPNNLTETQYGYLTGTKTAPTSGKNVNTYWPLNDSIAIFMRGMMASGRWMDVQQAVDYIIDLVEVALANVFLSKPKVAITTEDISEVKAAIMGVFAGLEDAGVLTRDREHVVNVPKVTAIGSAARAARNLSPAPTATCYLSGAFNFAQVNITVIQ